ILDEVERRRGVSAALVYPFMRSLMESPFPAPGKIIKVKTFLPGAGNEVIELRRPNDSRLEHVDFDSLFRCLSVRQVLRVFASLLLERRVIFVADKLRGPKVTNMLIWDLLYVALVHFLPTSCHFVPLNYYFLALIPAGKWDTITGVHPGWGLIRCEESPRTLCPTLSCCYRKERDTFRALEARVEILAKK
ncbi:hypothetical protein XENORESO_009139, partial [Xenotaenia resolanae]